MFVGRERELAELGEALGRAAVGTGGVCLVTGEPGIGKTRLASELVGAARERGARASWGRCWEAGGAPAYWPFREAFEGLGVDFPDPSTIVASDAAEARFALFRQVTCALTAGAARAPVLVVLEDVHAADRSSLLLLEFLVGQLHAARVLVLATYRELEASLRADAGDALARIGRIGPVLHLAPLRPAEVATLVRHQIEGADDQLAASVFDKTRGHPLFVAELVRDVRARGGAADGAIPLGVREIIRQRLGLVAAEARHALEAGAVLGVEFGVATLERMVAGAEAELDDAVRSGLVEARGDRLRFSHALYREALYHDLPRARRRALHREAARALEATGAPLAETAHHLLESGPDAAAEAIDHAIRAAGHAVDGFAFEDAFALLERARLAVPPGPQQTALRCRVLVALGEARVRSGDPVGRELCAEAAGLARGLGDAGLLAQAGLAYGAVFATGTVDPVLVGILEEALAGLPSGDDALRARVMARLAGARQPDIGELPRDVGLALDAIAMARRIGDRRVLVGVLHAACGALYGAAEPAVRLPISREQERLAEELGDRARLLHARIRLGMDLLESADFAAYGELVTAYDELARQIGPAASPWRVPLMRSMLALAADRFDESERWQLESRRIEADHPRARRAQGFHRIGFLRAAERHADLRASIPEERSLWRQMQIGELLAEPHAISSLARIGADDEVRALLAGLPDGPIENLISHTWLAEGVWLAGDPALARRLLPLLHRMGERWTYYWLDCEIAEAPMTRLIAHLSALVGDWDAAERALADALGKLAAAGRRSMIARVKFEYGDLLARSGRDLARAAALVAEARAGAGEVGLPELVALIDRRHPPRDPVRPRRAAGPAAGAGFAMVREGEYYAVATARGILRFRASRGMRYLAELVERPGTEIHVLELAGAGDHPDRGDAGAVVDPTALRAYRARLEALRDQAEDAELLGDVERAAWARGEMEAIAAELARGTGKSGRARRTDSAVDRARSAVQRRIKDALDRIAEQDAELGAWLRRAVRTGNHCSFRPAE